MNYQQTLDYLFSRLPMFQRIGTAAYKADLSNTIALCDLLDNPQEHFKSIHIAGTNGKGSTSHLLASVLQSAGYKVGLYTSPHLKDFRERIKINGKNIAEQYVVDFVEKYKTDFEKIEPSFFEMTVGLAFQYFKEQKVDVAVIEVGLGGRLDSTNIITPLLSVITNISFDHTALLGNTLEKIAFEKAGIIKSGIPVVVGETQEEIKNVFIEKAKTNNSEIQFADKIFEIKNVEYFYNKKQLLGFDIEQNDKLKFQKINCELLGLYQQKNLKTVLCAVDVLNKQGFVINENALREGIENVISQTGLLGRWQILSKNPLVIADTGHNEAGIKEVLEQIKNTPHEKLHFVLGVVNDKDVSSILNMLPKNATYYFCQAKIPRALPVEELKQIANEFKLIGHSYTSVSEALSQAKLSAGKDDLVFVGGSTFTVAEVV